MGMFEEQFPSHEALKVALMENAELREAFIVDSALPFVEERNGKIYLKEDIRLRVKSNQDAVEEYKQRVRESVEKVLGFHHNEWCSNDICVRCRMLKELGL